MSDKPTVGSVEAEAQAQDWEYAEHVSKGSSGFAYDSCPACEGSGEIFVRRNSRGKIDYIDGSPTGELTTCSSCSGEGVRQ